MLRDVAVLVDGEVHPFELGVACEVFGVDRSTVGVPRFDFAVCSSNRDPIRGAGGMWFGTDQGLARTESADLLVLPAWRTDEAPPSDPVIEAIRAAVSRGANVLAICSGTFLLAATGLLDGRRATCHWAHSDRLARRFPAVTVESDRLYVEEGPLVTSAGTGAGIDAALHVVRRHLGAEVANTIARYMVVPPHRQGGQAQYVDTPVPASSDPDLSWLLVEIQSHLDQEFSIDGLAARAGLSARTFARRFRAATGTSPHAWITRQRVLLAQRTLERDQAITIDALARRCGFADADLFRHHFRAQLGVTPNAYRRTFSMRAPI